MKIAVAGGTGTVGTHVVDVAHERGHEVVVLSRAAGVDLLSGDGLTDALAGVDAVIDVASTMTQNAKKSRAFFGTTTRHLLAAEQEAGVGHHVVLSIVGAAQSPHGYYAGKLLQEQLVTSGDVPWTMLRATQFHEFAGQIHGAVTLGPLVVVPRLRSQTVAAREVGERLVQLAEAGPSGLVPDLGGPVTAWMGDLVRAWARRTGDRRPILVVPVPGAGGRAMRDGTLVPADDADHGVVTFEQWLDTQRVRHGG